MKQKIDALIAYQSGTKHSRSPSIAKDPFTEEHRARDDEFLSKDQEEANVSSSKEPDMELSGSQERLLVQSLTELVCSTFLLPVTQSMDEPTSGLGLPKPSQSDSCFSYPFLSKEANAFWGAPR